MASMPGNHYAATTKAFIFSTRSGSAPECIQLPILCVLLPKSVFGEVEHKGREDDHSLSSDTEVGLCSPIFFTV